ncbi:MAG: hypothetical protein NTY09_01185 [bacterium]|nr:hypothetical protein [bacterium]
MKLYAQMGHGDGDKTTKGLCEGMIDGAILSPRELGPDRIENKIAQLIANKSDADILLDPQFYATFSAASESSRTGRLPEWSYFTAARKSELENPLEVENILKRTFDQMISLPLTAIIAPNIYVARSFDSREGVIAKSFIRNSVHVYKSIGDLRPLFATLALSAEAILERDEFEEFLNDITLLKDPPDGFYILIGGRGAEARTDIFHADVISRWMLLNYSLNINGFNVINGYSDMLAPFLGAAGASAGASGWRSGLRIFSLNRFLPLIGKARQPIIRYLSCRLLNRITFMEFDALSGIVNGIANGLPHDTDYDSEPDRESEALQSWEALREISRRLALDDVEEALNACASEITRAEAAYSEIAEAGIALDRKSNGDHLESLREGIQDFKKKVGLT